MEEGMYREYSDRYNAIVKPAPDKIVSAESVDIVKGRFLCVSK